MRAIEVPGRCRCGHVQYVLREEPISFYLCHCTECQAETGSAFGQSMTVRAEAIDAITGPLREHDVELDGGRGYRLAYCGDCITTMWGYTERLAQLRGLNAGSLDASAGFTPYGNMWTRSAQPWVKLVDGPQFEGQPEDPLAMVRAWQDRNANGS